MTDKQEPLAKVNSSKWTSHISKWRESGQSQSGYCKEHNLNYLQFNQAVKRQRKLAERVESGFVEIKSVLREAEENWSLAISFPNGMQLQTSGQLPATHLIAIIKELRG